MSLIPLPSPAPLLPDCVAKLVQCSAIPLNAPGLRAHGMRVAPSEPERVLWLALRAGQLGVRFQRQVVVRGFIVDFFAPAARLVVEVDGTQHERCRQVDGRRDRALEAAGLRVLRVPARVVLHDLARAIELVGAAVEL